MPLFVSIVTILGLSGAVLAGCAWLYRRPAAEPYRIREERGRKLKGARLVRSAVINSTLSVALVLGTSWWASDALFTEELPAWWVLPLQAIAILGVYDVAYYFVHRFAFHRWSVLKGVHAVHHMARYPTAIDALFLHPVETTIGLGLLFGSTWVVGPVHVYAFAGAFLVYSLLNILIHAGLSRAAFPFRAISYLARKHDQHHTGMQSGNFASITPLCDLLFRTAQ